MNKKQKRNAKLKRQQELVNAAKTANRALTAEEQAEFDTLQREIEQLNTEIEAEERQLQTPPPAPAPTGDPAPAPAPTSDEQQREIQMAERRRISDITTMCRDFDIDPVEYIDNGSTVDQVRAAIVEKLRSARGP